MTSTDTPSLSLSSSQLDMLRALFCYEFEVDSLDRASLPEATEDAVEEWIDAIEMSGLFAPSELRTMTSAWRSEPDALLALLVGDVDEFAVRRESSPALNTAEPENRPESAIDTDQVKEALPRAS